METQNTHAHNYKLEKAKKQVEELKGFYIHFAIYLIFVPIFIGLNYYSGTSYPWAIFPILGWGLGVAGHATETFNYNPFFGKNWERRKIQEFLDNEE